MPSSSAQVSAGGSSGDLHVKLVWLTVFRAVATTLFLVVIAARLFSRAVLQELTRDESFAFVVLGLAYAATLAYGLLLRKRQVGAFAAYAQIVGDIVIASLLVYLTGGAESPLTFSYSIAVVAASILLFQRGALVAAAISSGAFALLVLLVQAQLLGLPSGTQVLSNARVGLALASNTLALFLIAALAGYLARQLSATGGRLSAREADLRALWGLQQQILTAMPSGLLTCDGAGKITYVNRAGQAILGLPEEPGPLLLEVLLPGLSRLDRAVRRTELQVATPRGQQTLGLTRAPLEHEDGAELVVFQDLTELRRAEEELKRVDQLAALGRLAAQLAHEIRNPLAAMRGSAQMLAQDLHDLPARRLTTILVREADRLSGLVEDFLRFARPPPPSLAPVSLRELAEETVEMLRADPLARGIGLSLSLAEVRAEVDSAQLRQVLINLLRNAFAAAPGGSVRVSVVEDPQGPRLSVWDSAGSIPEKDLARIFEPFYTTREGGTGLGLSTAHTIVRAHGGTIQVTSSPGAGTEFTLVLPPATRSAGTAEQAQAIRGEVAGADPGRR